MPISKKEFDFTDIVETPNKEEKFDFSDVVETPLKKKEDTKPLESTFSTPLVMKSKSQSEGDTSANEAYGTTQLGKANEAKPIDGAAIPQIKSVDLTSVQNVDPDQLKQKISENINKSITSKKEAQTFVSQKQQELEMLKQRAETLNQQYQNADPETQAQISQQINELGLKMPELDAQINEANNEIQRQNKVISYQENVNNAIKSKKEDKGYLSELAGSLEAGSAQVGASLAKTPAMIYDIFALPQNFIAEKTGLPIGTSSTEAAKQLGLPENKVAEYYDKVIGDHQKEIQSKYDKGITEYIGNGDYANALKLLGNQIMESAPMSISLMAGNAAGIGAIGTTVGGGVVFGAQNKDELDKNSNLSEVEKTTNAFSKGILEGMTEAFGITKLGSIARGVLENEGKKVATEVAKKSFKELYTPIAKQYFGNTAEEVVGEMANQFASNAVDKYSGYKPDVKLTDGVIDAGIVGLGSSFAFSAPLIAKEISNAKRGNKAPVTRIADEILTPKEGLTENNKAAFEKAQEHINDPQSAEQFNEGLQADVELGNITPKEAEAIGQKMSTIQELDSKVPENITEPTTRLTAINLLEERTQIEQSIEGKDKALTIPQTERIKVINEALGALSKGATIEQIQLIINPKTNQNESTSKSTQENSGSEKIGTEVNANEGQNGNEENGQEVLENSAEPISPTVEFEQFVNIVNESKTSKEAFDKAREVKGVSADEAQAFSDKYNPNGKLSMEQAFDVFYNEKKATANNIKPQEDSTISILETVQAEPKNTPEPNKAEGKSKESKIGQRVEGSDTVPNEAKQILKEKGTTYISRSLEMVASEAKEITDAYESEGKIEELENFVLSPTSKIKGDVKNALVAALIDKYTKLSIAETSPEKKEFYNQKIVDIAYAQIAEQTEAGQKINSIKLINKVLRKNPEAAVVGVQKDIDKQNEPTTKKYKKAMEGTKEALLEFLETEEGSAIIEEKINEAISKKKNIFTRTKSERKARIKELEERLKERRKTLSSSIVGLTKEDIEIYGELGAEYIADGIYNFAKWSKKMMDKLGLTEDEAKQIWDSAKVKDTDKTLVEFANDKKVENNKKRAEALKKQAKDLDTLIKNPEKVIKDLEERKKTKEGKDVPNSEMEVLNAEIKDKKNLVKLIEKLGGLDAKQKKQVILKSLDAIIKNGYLSDIKFKNIFAEALGLRHLTEADEANIKKFATDIAQADIATEKYLKEPTPNKKKASDKAMLKARESNDKLSEFFRPEKTILGNVPSYIQGNLLGITSTLNNILSNVMFGTFRGVGRAAATATDWALSKGAKLKGEEYQRTHDYVAFLKGYKPLIGAKEGLRQMVTGALSEDYENRDLRNGLHPLDAFMRVFSKSDKKGKELMYQKVSDTIEGVLGVSPEIMFRLQNLGDKITKRAFESGAKSEQGALQGLKGVELEKFIALPPEKILELVEQEAKESTLQQDNALLDLIKRKTPESRIVADLVKIAVVSQAPYIKTPTNFIKEVYDYAIPPIAFAQAIYHAKEGNRRKALEYWGKGIVGSAVTGLVFDLISKGIIKSGDDDEEKKSKKEGRFLDMYDKPTYVNMSALRRYFNPYSNKDYKKQVGDTEWDLRRLGLFGAMAIAAQKSGVASIEKDAGLEKYLEAMLYMFPAVTKTAFETSFLTGTNTMLNAIDGGKVEKRKFVVSTANTLLAPFAPATIGAISKGSDTVKRNTKDISLSQEVINNFKLKWFSGRGLPPKINLWGEDIPSAPKGSNAYLYYIFNVVKVEDADPNQFGVQIYDLYKRTGDNGVIPPEVSQTVIINEEKIKLDEKQYTELLRLVGRARAEKVKLLLGEDDFNGYDDEEKTDALKGAYTEGRTEGIESFNAIYGQKINKQTP